MANRISAFRTWADKDFKKSYKKLSRREKDRYERRVEELIGALSECSHPVSDPALRKFRPTTYHIAYKGEGALLEYHLPGTGRVIVCWIEEESRIVLVAVTLNHDHDRLRRLIQKHGPDLGKAG